MTFANKRIAVGDITLNVIDEGTGPAVLLIHGFPDDHAVWRKQIPVLVAAGYRVIAPDMRGCGESDMPQRVSGYRMHRLIADLVAVLDALELKQVPVIGHDWGSVIGWSFAMHCPTRVTRFAALSVGHPLAYAKGGLEQKLKGWYVLMFQLRGFAELLLRVCNWRVFRLVIQQADEADHWVARLRRPGRLTAALSYYRANLSMLTQRQYPAALPPVLGIWSSGDRFLSKQQMLDSAQFTSGGWRYEQVDNASHWLQLEAPEKTNKLLLGFLQTE